MQSGRTVLDNKSLENIKNVDRFFELIKNYFKNFSSIIKINLLIQVR